jgi:aquaporin Z
VFVGDWALLQLWLFWVAPVLGAALAGVAFRLLAGPEVAGEETLREALSKPEQVEVVQHS